MNGAGEPFFAGAHHDLVRSKKFAIDFDGAEGNNRRRRNPVRQPEFQAIAVVFQAVFKIKAP